MEPHQRGVRLLDPDTATNLLNVLPGEGAVRIKKQVLIDALARLRP